MYCLTTFANMYSESFVLLQVTNLKYNTFQFHNLKLSLIISKYIISSNSKMYMIFEYNLFTFCARTLTHLQGICHIILIVCISIKNTPLFEYFHVLLGRPINITLKVI